VDLHKFGYAPRSVSAVCYLEPASAARATFAAEDWMGLPYRADRLGAQPPLAPIAGAWAVMHALGVSGYRDLARRLRDRRDALLAGLADSGVDASCAKHGAVLMLRPRTVSLQTFSGHLLRADVPHTICRIGFVRVRVDALIGDEEFSRLAGRLIGAAGRR
jgi:glutamate/tyrosine decarboxylase-like PLP-dependent enzyme